LVRELRWVAAVIVGAAFLLWLVLLAPKLVIPSRPDASLAEVRDPAKRHELEDGRLRLQNEARTSLLQALGGAVVALGAVFTYRQLQHNIESSREQHELDRQQQELERQGQITERFNKAIDHLGSDKLDLRLGGIYALERIAKNSDDDRDTIAEILAAFVRQRSPWPPSQPGQHQDDFPFHQQPSLRTRATDIQAVLTVLGRGNFTRHGALVLDLAEVDLRKAGLHGAHLEAENLGGTQLQAARLDGAHLEGATLTGAHLEDSYLGGANLERANLGRAHLDNADLRGARLNRANLRGARLQAARLNDARLEEAILSATHLERSDLSGTDLQRAKLSGARLQEAILTGANLARATLRGANLEYADLSDADLQRADLAGAYVQHTDLTGAHLEGAVATADTVWPDDFDATLRGIEFRG
jgi:uncharacterized protein YjbI with pentapeptide repeats